MLLSRSFTTYNYLIGPVVYDSLIKLNHRGFLVVRKVGHSGVWGPKFERRSAVGRPACFWLSPANQPNPHLNQICKNSLAGGEGGRGMTANGGPGGIGSGCSAGAGAAGQTSGGGHGGLEAGSSTYPFCGAGGSSGGTTCGTEFENIAPGSSGPGGQDPVGRAGGLYGGGGGSRAGARAGGGGGYSRRVIAVTPGQEIPVVVGGPGQPFYPGGRPAPGVVVVSWGGPIDPNRVSQKLPTSS